MCLNSRKFFIETYGCQMNVSDSEIICTILTNAGFEKANSIDEADIILFNTCSVRQNAEERVLGRISNEASRKKTNPSLKMGIVGCMAQNWKQELLKNNSAIDFVLGVDSYEKLPKILEYVFQDQRITNTILDESTDYNNFLPSREGRNNAFVTIMRGCNNYCSYCIVPHVRGRERSRPYESIIKEVKQAGDDDFKDITLLGQNVNSYNWNGIKFPHLLRKINAIDSIKRIRFVTSHPKDLSDELIKAMSECEKVCEHIHLPLQSGNNQILERMNRKYTREHYLGLIDKLRKYIPDIAITTDVIAGFPGESEIQFQETCDIMKEIEFDYAFMFHYSERKGTIAAKFEDQIPVDIRLKRLSELIDLQTEITHKKYRNKIGNIEEVYVEQVSKKSSDEMSGRTRDFKIAVFRGDESYLSKFIHLKITEANGWTLRGELINP